MTPKELRRKHCLELAIATGAAPQETIVLAQHFVDFLISEKPTPVVKTAKKTSRK